MPWWGHVIVLVLILGGTAASVVTGNPLYAWLLVPCGWLVGSVLTTPRWSAAVRRGLTAVARSRATWLVIAGLLFATFAATVATLAVNR